MPQTPSSPRSPAPLPRPRTSTAAPLGSALAALFVLATPTSARAEVPPRSPPQIKNAIVFEPLAVILARAIAFEYERGLGPVGVHLGFAVTLGDLTTDDSRDLSFHGLAWTLGARIYPWSDAPNGPFIGPFGSLAWAEAGSASGLGFSVGALAGWSTTLGGSFQISLGGGAAWHSAWAHGDERIQRRGFKPSIRLAVGAAF